MARKFVFLTREEEIELIALNKQGCAVARAKLTESFDPLISKIARTYAKRFRGIEAKQDIKQHATIGFLNGIDKFDPDKGFRISTYVRWHILAEVTDFMINNHSLVKSGHSKLSKDMYYKLHKYLADIENKKCALTNADKTAMATEFQVDQEQFDNVYNWLMNPVASLNQAFGEEDAGDWIESIADPYISDPFTVLLAKEEEKMSHKLLANALLELDERERAIFVERKLAKTDDFPSLTDLGKRFGFSAERARQIEARATDKVFRAVHTQFSGQAIAAFNPQ